MAVVKATHNLTLSVKERAQIAWHNQDLAEQLQTCDEEWPNDAPDNCKDLEGEAWTAPFDVTFVMDKPLAIGVKACIVNCSHDDLKEQLKKCCEVNLEWADDELAEKLRKFLLS